ncbi:YdhR family protein [Pseudofrankia inefficax]|nr:YdhR family protein [Pseudofrankia inefficax]
MERSADAPPHAGSLSSAANPPRRGAAAMRIRIVTFGLTIPVESYNAHAVQIAPEFTAWPGLLGKWWLSDTVSATFGGVYLFASRRDADRSRETGLFQGLFANPALKDITVQEYDVLDTATAITAPTTQTSALQETP